MFYLIHLYQALHFISISLPHFRNHHVPLLTMMMNRESSLHNRGATTIQTDYTQLGISNHTTYAGLWPTDINLHPDPPKHDRVQRHPRVQYTSNPALGYEGTYYSRHLSTPCARLAVHMMELPRS
jgi:hypothetical protein